MEKNGAGNVPKVLPDNKLYKNGQSKPVQKKDKTTKVKKTKK